MPSLPGGAPGAIVRVDIPAVKSLLTGEITQGFSITGKDATAEDRLACAQFLTHLPLFFLLHYYKLVILV